MKLTERDRTFLESRLGYSEEEVNYIERGEYSYSSLLKSKVSETFVLTKVGKKSWLMGIAMASYNAACVCHYKNGNGEIRIKRL